MAYVQDEELKKQQQQAAGGQVLAGSGGAAGASKASGTGWTNLQSYLDANQGNTGGIATSVNNAMNKEFEGAAKAADESAKAWGDGAVKQAQAADQSEAMRAGATDYSNTIKQTNQTYQGPKQGSDVEGYNDLEKNYKAAEQAADKYTGYSGMKEGLASQNNYGSGFGALDAFLGVRREMPAIQAQANANKAGLKAEDGRYRGMAEADSRVQAAAKQSADNMKTTAESLKPTIETQGRDEGLIFDTPAISVSGDGGLSTAGGFAGGVAGPSGTWEELLAAVNTAPPKPTGNKGPAKGKRAMGSNTR